MIEAFDKLPLAIEIVTARGTVGLLHAEVPIGMDWEQFKQNVLAGNTRTIHSALWGRTRAEQGEPSGVGVKGVGRLYVGHTPQWKGLRRNGNIYFLDTGAVFYNIGREDEGRLTLVNAITHTEDLLQPKPYKPIDVREGRMLATPFGTSLVSAEY